MPAWDALSKAFSRSNMMHVVLCCLLKPSVICWFSLRMWSAQLFFLLKPAWQSGRMLFCSAHNISLAFMIFSRHLLRQLISDIGLYEEKLSLGMFFFAIIIILECFQLVGR